jgi:hypothetical protein
MTEILVDRYAEDEVDFDSSSIYVVAYDRETKTLFVEFYSSDTVYAYEGVEESTYEMFVEADSLNRFWRNYISGKYTSEKHAGASFETREASEPETEVDDAYLTANQMRDHVALNTGSVSSGFISSILAAPSRYSVKWENTEGTIGGHPEYQAMSEQDALAQCRAAIEAAGIDGYKIVSVTHYLV